jgi:hypothetical protein
MENNSDLFNWFETKKSIALMGKQDNYDSSATGIKPNSRILCCGTTGSGKTQALLHYIRLSPDLFARVIVFYKEKEHLYDLLNKGLKGRVEFHSTLTELPTLKDLRKGMDADEKILIVLDDQMTEMAKCHNLTDYLTYGRKKGITIFLLSQNYYSVPKPLRNQLTYLLLFRLTQRKDINLILSEYDNKDKELEPIYKSIIKDENNFMKITTNICPKGTKISRNFTGYIEDYDV